MRCGRGQQYTWRWRYICRCTSYITFIHHAKYSLAYIVFISLYDVWYLLLNTVQYQNRRGLAVGTILSLNQLRECDISILEATNYSTLQRYLGPRSSVYLCYHNVWNNCKYILPVSSHTPYHSPSLHVYHIIYI